MSDNDGQRHMKLINRFVEIANAMKDEGHPVEMVNHAMMCASSIYASYSVAGNEGFLQDSGIDKVSGMYRDQLVRVREMRQQELKAQGKLED